MNWKYRQKKVNRKIIILIVSVYSSKLWLCFIFHRTFHKTFKEIESISVETLRVYPPGDNLIRIASNDYKIPDTELVIEKDTLVFIPLYGIQHDPEIFPEPNKFDPERFSDENKKNRHPMAYLPFGEGPRKCIGPRFALMQVKIGLIHLLTNFKFSASSKTTIPMEFLPSAGILAPINDMWLRVEKLSAWLNQLKIGESLKYDFRYLLQNTN